MEFKSSVWLLSGVFTLCLISTVDCGRIARDDSRNELTVTTIEQEPYLMKKGNNKFEGFIPDMLEAIERSDKMLAFKLEVVSDGEYGAFTSGRWSGMMGELTHGDADLAAAPFTLSDERERYVDFSDAFMDVHLTILLKKPDVGTESTITSATDLADDATMNYGCIKDGFTFNFFKNSRTGTTFSKMWDHMEKHPEHIFDNIDKGVEKVRSSNGKYAFIMESTTAEYYVNKQPCDLTTVGSLQNINYALAVRQGSNYKDTLNKALSNLRSDNVFEELREKWWGGDCVDANAAQKLTTHSNLALVALIVLFKI